MLKTAAHNRLFSHASAPSFDRFKNWFFDRDRVLAAADAMTRRALSKWGAFVRKGAQHSLRYETSKRAKSQPGEPPVVHRSGRRKRVQKDGTEKMQSVSPLREFIFFAYEPSNNSVIVGPAKTNQVFFNRHRQPVTGTVPSVLEYGGEITILEIFRHGQWQRADLRSRRRLTEYAKRFRTARIEARPYMRPAAARELTNPKLRDLFHNQLRDAGISGGRRF